MQKYKKKKTGKLLFGTGWRYLLRTHSSAHWTLCKLEPKQCLAMKTVVKSDDTKILDSNRANHARRQMSTSTTMTRINRVKETWRNRSTKANCLLLAQNIYTQMWLFKITLFNAPTYLFLIVVGFPSCKHNFVARLNRKERKERPTENRANRKYIRILSLITYMLTFNEIQATTWATKIRAQRSLNIDSTEC